MEKQATVKKKELNGRKMDIQDIRKSFCCYRIHQHHHHHWLDSPWWALAFLRSFAHSSPLRATFFAMSSPADQSGFNFFRFRNNIF